MCMYLHDSPNEIKTPTRHILVGRRMTAPPPLLLPSSMFPPPSQCALIPVQKNSACLAKVFFSLFYFFRKLLSLKLRKSGSVYCQGCSHSGRKFFPRKSIRTASGAILFVETRGLVSRGKAAGSGKWPLSSSYHRSIGMHGPLPSTSDVYPRLGALAEGQYSFESSLGDKKKSRREYSRQEIHTCTCVEPV